MKKPTIYEIKYEVEKRGSHYFSKNTMKFFGQTLRSFKVYKTDNPDEFLMTAKSGSNWKEKHETRHIYNAVTKEIKPIPRT